MSKNPKRSASEVLEILRNASRNIPEAPKAGTEYTRRDIQRAFSYIHSDPLSKTKGPQGSGR